MDIFGVDILHELLYRYLSLYFLRWRLIGPWRNIRFLVILICQVWHILRILLFCCFLLRSIFFFIFSLIYFSLLSDFLKSYIWWNWLNRLWTPYLHLSSIRALVFLWRYGSQGWGWCRNSVGFWDLWYRYLFCCSINNFLIWRRCKSLKFIVKIILWLLLLKIT